MQFSQRSARSPLKLIGMLLIFLAVMWFSVGCSSGSGAQVQQGGDPAQAQLNTPRPTPRFRIDHLGIEYNTHKTINLLV